ERANAVSKITPEPIDANGRTAPAGRCYVGHCRRQVGIKQRHAKTGYGGRCGPPPHATAHHHHADTETRNPHAQHIGPVTSNVIGKPPGEKLRTTPDE